MSSVYRLSMILSQLYVIQLNWDIPVAISFVNMSKIGHREVKNLPQSHTMAREGQRVFLLFDSFLHKKNVTPCF